MTAHPDPLLASFVAAGRATPTLAMPVTLLVAGSVIDGEMVSEAVWLDALATALEAGGPSAAALGDRLRTVKVHVEMAAEDGVGSDLVHLRGARVHAGGRVVSAGLWRVGLTAVDGWKLGAPLPAAISAAR